MGMYTEFHFHGELVQGVSHDVLNTLSCLGSGASAGACFDPLFRVTKDDYEKTTRVTIKTSLKNYNEEIENWLKLFAEYVPDRWYNPDCLGYYHCEESDYPSLVYYNDEKRQFEIIPVTKLATEIPSMRDDEPEWIDGTVPKKLPELAEKVSQSRVGVDSISANSLIT